MTTCELVHEAGSALDVTITLACSLGFVNEAGTLLLNTHQN